MRGLVIITAASSAWYAMVPTIVNGQATAQPVQPAAMTGSQVQSQGISGALAQELVIVNSRKIDNDVAYEIAADQSRRRLAISFSLQFSNHVGIFSLPSMQKTASIPNGFRVEGLAWSPNGRNLYISGVGGFGRVQCAIVDVDSRKVTDLPGSSGCAQGVDLRWINDSIVSSSASRCNLNTLTCATLGGSVRGDNKTARLGSPLSNARISAGYHGLWATDLKDGSTRWLDRGDIRGVGFAGPSALIVGHWAKGGTFLLQIAKQAPGPLLVAIPVGTVLPSSEARMLVGLLAAGASLTADICEPQLNPINNRPIGADCSRRRGSITFRRIRSDSLIGKITTHYAATRVNDVLANFNLPVYFDTRDKNTRSPTIRLKDGLLVTLELAHFRQENYVENQDERSYTTENAQVIGQPGTQRPEYAAASPARGVAVSGRNAEPSSAPPRAPGGGDTNAPDAFGAAIRSARYSGEFDQLDTTVAVSVERVRTGLRTILDQLRFRILADSDALLVAESSSNNILFTTVRTYYVSVEPSPSNSGSTRLRMKLLFIVRGNPEREPRRSPRDARREMSRTVESLLSSLRSTP